MPESDPEARLRSLAWLAGVLLERPIAVAWGEPGRDSRIVARGIEIDPALDAFEQRCAVVAQALWRRHAGEATGHCAPTAARPALLRRYGTFLLAWALEQQRDRIPDALARHLRNRLLDGPVPARDPRSAWALARSGASHATLPACVGRLEAAAFRPLDEIEPRAEDTHRAATPAENGDAPLDDDARALLERLRSPVRGLGLADVLLRLLGFSRGDARTQDHPGRAEGATALAHGASARDPARGPLAAFARKAAEVWRGPPRDGHWYPEWDARRRAYRPRHACVADIDPLVDDSLAPPPAPAPLTGLLKRLSRIGATLASMRGQPDGHDLDLDACIDARVRRRAGGTPSRGLFIGARRTRRDLSVLVLLDLSRSTADTGPDGETQLQVHQRVAEQLVAAFERLGDDVGLFGFHSWGATLVRFVRIKGFDERWAASRRRLAVLEPCGMTRTGAAVRHAGRSLAERRRHRRRLLLLLTDGHPHDDGYEGAHAAQDTRHALSELAADGIATLALHVGGAPTDAALAAAYGDGAWLRVDHARELVAPLGPLLARALARADTSRARQRVRDAHGLRVEQGRPA